MAEEASTSHPFTVLLNFAVNGKTPIINKVKTGTKRPRTLTGQKYLCSKCKMPKKGHECSFSNKRI